MKKHSFTFEQYCNIIGRNIILEETTFHNGCKKIRCLNAHKCETMNGGCLNSIIKKRIENCVENTIKE